jgi:hypothetical protein
MKAVMLLSEPIGRREGGKEGRKERKEESTVI